jgi:PH domain
VLSPLRPGKHLHESLSEAAGQHSSLNSGDTCSPDRGISSSVVEVDDAESRLTAAPELESWLEKASVAQSKLRWQRRYFVLNRSCVFYYKVEDRHEWRLDRAFTVFCDDTYPSYLAGTDTVGYTFQVKLPDGNTLALATPSHDDLMHWVTVLRNLSVAVGKPLDAPSNYASEVCVCVCVCVLCVCATHRLNVSQGLWFAHTHARARSLSLSLSRSLAHTLDPSITLLLYSRFFCVHNVCVCVCVCVLTMAGSAKEISGYKRPVRPTRTKRSGASTISS